MRVIAGAARSVPLKAPKGLEVRPTTDKIKETLFNILNFDIGGCDFLDLFSGSGAIGIEALSRGAASVTFVEQNKQALECIKGNLQKTKLEENARILPQDAGYAISLLEREGSKFDIIYMDPPYEAKYEEEMLDKLSSGRILKRDTIIIIEAGLDNDFSWAAEKGYILTREKRYKTNKHVFFRKQIVQDVFSDIRKLIR